MSENIESDSAVGKRKLPRFSFNLIPGCAITLALVFLLLIGVGVAIGLNFSSPRAEIDAMFAAIRERGEPVTLDELQAWYDAKTVDLGAAPLYQQAFDKYYHDTPQSLTEREAELLPVVGNAEFENNEALPGETLDAMHAYLIKHQKSLDLLHEASLEAECRFPLDLRDGMQVELPHLAKLRHATRLQSLRAYAAVEIGDSESAHDALLEGLRYPYALKNEPTLISQLVRVSCRMICVDTLERALCRVQFAETQLGSLKAAYGNTDSHTWWRLAYLGERCFLSSKISELAKVRGLSVEELPDRSFLAQEELLVRLPLTRRWLFEMDLYQFLTLSAQALHADELGFPKRLPEFERIEKTLLEDSDFCPLTRILLPAFLRGPAAFARETALSRMAETALALEMYRLGNDRLPNTLEALVPDYLDAVPEDPFDGNPLRYHPQQNGYTVYSVYVNGRDDGGVEFEDLKEGDLVFAVRR